MSGQHPLIEILVFGIVAAFLLGLLARKLRLPPILGYLVAGLLIGPYTPGYVGDAQLASEIAEIGVILLLFGVGLHFSISDLFSIRKISLPGAVFQISSAVLLGTGLAYSQDVPLHQAIIFSIPLSVASTVVLLRALESLNILDTPTGKIAIGWLIVEDIVMVLGILLLPVFANVLLMDGALSVVDISKSVVWALLKILCVAVLMLVVGKRIIPGFLYRIVKIKSKELTSLSVLAIALGFAYFAYVFFDASFALGAFLAGMMLNGSETGAKVVEQSLPLRDVFSVLFFVSVGMLFDPMVVVNDTLTVFAAVFIVLIGKSVAAYGITRLFTKSNRSCFLVAASLAQIGEFSFIFAGMSRQLDLLPANLYDVILACSLISIALNPFLFKMVFKFTKGPDEGGVDGDEELARKYNISADNGVAAHAH